MSRVLHVYINGAKVGDLAEGDLSFTYDASWLSGKAPCPLSLSLPLQGEPLPADRSRAFFANLLPEGQVRDHFARKYRVSPDDDFALLAALGGDCAGAAALHPEPLDGFSQSPPSRYRPLTDADFGKLLDEAYIMDPSFLDEGEHTRLSLAGVQDKIPVALRGETILLPLDGAPSTHILKPPNPRFPGLVENEAFCMALGGAMGLRVPNAFLLPVKEREPVYLVERYDRHVGDEDIVRIHQEDFCQATGISYRRKYEEKGGPGFRVCFQVIGQCRNPLAERIRLIELAIFNFLIGNADCHAKNLSLLYDHGPNPSFAPAYDLVCTGIYGLSRRMAMAIGGVYDPRDVTGQAWIAFAEEAGSRSPKPVVDSLRRMATEIPGKAREMAAGMTARYGEHPVYEEIVQLINHRAEVSLRQLRHV